MAHFKGTIKIYCANNHLLESKPYYSKEGRLKIMQTWETDFADTGHQIRIYPYALTPNVSKQQKQKLITIPIEPKRKFVRPPAIYDNKKSIYN